MQLVARSAPTQLDIVDTLPRSITAFGVPESVYLEIWASRGYEYFGAGSGLASVYVDVLFDPSFLKVEGIEASNLFELFAHSHLDPQSGVVHALGGCAPLGEDTLGVSSTWVLVATLQMRVLRSGATVIETSPSEGPLKVSIFNRSGDLNDSQVRFGRTKLEFKKRVHPTRAKRERIDDESQP